MSSPSTESLFIEIRRPLSKNIIIGVIYRPPDSNVNKFVQNFSSLLAKIGKENKLSHLLGDFNLNLMNYHSHSVIGEFPDVTYANLFVPLLLRPTRITSHSASLVDNIFTNSFCNDIVSGLFYTDVSDHLPSFAIHYEQSVNNDGKKSFVSFRDKNTANITKFHERLRSTDWINIYNYSNVNTAYSCFLNKYSEIFNSCFPIRKIKASECALKKPWLSTCRLKSIKRKNLLYKKYLKSPTPFNESSYKKYRNRLNHSLRLAKRSYYEAKLKSLTANIKGTWNILNQVINRTKRPDKLPSTLVDSNNQDISDPRLIANQFCNFFTTLGPSLARKIPTSVKCYRFFLPERSFSSFFFESATQCEIVEITNSLRINTAAGHDKVPMWSVKESINYISGPSCSNDR